MGRADLISAMIGKEMATLEALESEAAKSTRDRTVEPILSAKDVSRRGGIQKTSVDLFEGEVVGFAGLLGSGRTELARLLYGADKTETGEISYQGKKIDLKDPMTGLMNHIAYSTDRKSTRLNSSHVAISYAVFCLKKKKTNKRRTNQQ